MKATDHDYGPCMSTPETGQVASHSHRRLFRDLTVRSGDFDLRPTATAWWLKDITLLGLVASCALTWEGQRDEELVVSATDVGFRSAASLVSTVLLASLVCPRPALFRRCFWAHAGCLPADTLLSVAFVLLKAEEMFSSDYAGPARLTPRSSRSEVAPYVDGRGGTGSGTEDSSGRDVARLLHERRSTAATDKNSSSRTWQNYDRAVTPDADPHLTSWRLNERDGPDETTVLARRLQVIEAMALEVAARCNLTSNIAAVSRDSLKGEEQADENRLRKAAAARHQLAVFTLADHVICIFARSYLLMRMRAYLAALASAEADADSTPLEDAPRTLCRRNDVMKTENEGRRQVGFRA